MWPAEVFPIWTRGRASSLSGACHGVFAMLAYSGFNQDARKNGEEIRLLLFAGASAVLGCVFYATMPETEGIGFVIHMFQPLLFSFFFFLSQSLFYWGCL